MFTQPASHNRFNLLLLSEGEQYFSDYSAIFFPNCATDAEAVSKQIKGRLKVCSKSIFFDPEEASFPIIRYDYQKVYEMELLRTGVIAQMNNGETFYVKTKQVVQMKENNMIKPYTFMNADVQHRFAIKYVSIKPMMDEVKRLWSIAKSSSYDGDEKIKRIVEERELKVQFDLTWMESFDERSLYETLANKITPLVSNAGRLVITNKMIYFQPLNNVAATPVEKYYLRDVIRIVKRRHELRPLAIEIFLEDLSFTSHNDSSTTSVFFSFRDASTRDKVFDMLSTMPGLPRLENSSAQQQAQTTWKWQTGQISNYEYLLYLNNLAHRSFNDLTQYPVFPWVIADYTSPNLNLSDPKTFRDLSKPIGALNAERLAAFRRRYNDTPEDQDRFLYGTHYSTPAYVLYYLVRMAPEYMLKLQNGRFDEAERLFNSIEDTWQNVLTNPADLKELIPEFFSSDLGLSRSGGEFLCNNLDISFGRRMDGTPVGDVALPPWARNAADFVRLNREALESDHVSDNLHLWIDLIFGYKQRGKEALQADNLFHPLTYEGAVDIEKEKDPNRRAAILIQINEFGQTPGKIFDRAHPSRFSADERRRMKSDPKTQATSSNDVAAPSSSFNYNSSSSTGLNSSLQGSTFLSTPSRGNSSPLSGSTGSIPAYSPNSSQSSLPPYSTPSQPSATLSTPLVRTFGATNAGFASTSSLNSSWRAQPESADAIRASQPLEFAPSAISPDPTIEQLLGTLGQLSTSPGIIIPEHKLESLEAFTQNSNSRNAATSSRSGFVDEWAAIAKFSPVDTWKSHRQGVTAICLSGDGETLYSVSQDSSLKIYSLAEGKQLRSNNISQLALSSCALSKDQKFVAIGSWDNNIYLYSNDYGRVITTIPAHDDTVSCLTLRENVLVSGSWDTTMKVWNVTKTGLHPDPLMELSCLDSAIKAVHLNFDMNMALCGSEDGMLAIADIRSGHVVRTWSAHEDAIASAQFTTDGRIISCSVAGTLKVQESNGNDIFSVQIADGFHCMATNGTRLLTGDTSSSLRSWDLLLGNEIGRVKRTPESPITCVAVSEKCDFAITGSEDGSLTKWVKK